MTRPVPFRHAVFGVLAALVLARCGGDGTGPSQPRPAAIALVSGNTQTGTVAQSLAQPLIVRVTTSGGAGVEGVAVSWTVTGGGGSVSASATTTGANGQASVTWTLGTEAGANNNTATAAVSGLAGSPVTFTATANPGPATQLAILSGKGQVGAVGQALAQPLVVAARDQYLNGVRDVAVTWAVASGGGAVSSNSVATDAAGHASVTWTLGTAAGTEKDTVTATVAGLTGSPATFTASGTPGAAAQLVMISGDGQSVQVAQAVAQPLVAAVRDQYGNAVSGVAVGWAVVTGGGSVSASSVPTDADGKSSVTWTLGTAAGTHTSRATLAGVSASPVTFSATATPGPAAQLAVAGGNGQTAPAATTLPLPLSTRVTDTYGNGVSEITVSWSVLSGEGTVSTNASPTGPDGVATTGWTLGRFAGSQTASASAGTLQGSPQTFGATATPNATISGTITLANAYLAPPSTSKTLRAGPSLAALRGPERTGAPGRLDIARVRTSPSLPPPQAPLFPPNEILVTYRPRAVNAPPVGSRALAARTAVQVVGSSIRAHVAAFAAGRPVRLRGVSPAILAARLHVDDPAEIPRLIGLLRADPAVAAVQRNGLLWRHDAPPVAAVQTTANDPLYPWQAWHYAMIDLPRAWDVTRGSVGVLVAVIDDGIRFDHPDVAGNLTSDGYDFVSDLPLPLCSGGTLGSAGDGDGYDPDPTIPAVYGFDEVGGCVSGPEAEGGHGLHVTGTIGAVGNDGMGVTGVNWTVRIRPVRALGVTGTGDFYDIAQAVLYAAGLPADDGAGGTVQAPSAARLINMSLGGPSAATVLENAVISATNAGSLIIASAGNAGTSTPNYPAAYPQTVSVSAVGPDVLVASYSSFGSTVDIAAPGGDLADGDFTYGVFSTVWNFSANQPTYQLHNGTSMAAPHVTGVAALLLAQNPGLTAADGRSRLTDYAVDLGAAGRDDFYGAGLVNARNSLTQSFGPPASLYAQLYNAATGAVAQTVAAQPDGSYAFTALADGEYLVYAGQDENGDSRIGEPGRRWGAFGGSATPLGITVSGADAYPASFAIGLPIEIEPNNFTTEADFLPVGGYLTGVISDPSTDQDVSVVRIPVAGQYTFETTAVSGACGFALEEDTILGLYDSGGSLIVSNDDIDFGAYNLCSRVTQTLSPGVYYVGIFGYRGGSYRVQARSGS